MSLVYDLKMFAEVHGTNAGDYVVGDGVTNDNSALDTCILDALGAHGDDNKIYGYHVVYIPENKEILLSNLQILDYRDILFVGAGRSSVFKQQDGAGGIITFERCKHYGYCNMSIDYNGAPKFGGMRNYEANGAWIVSNNFYDSRPVGIAIDNGDRYAIVFGSGPTPSRNIYFGENNIKDLQCEFDHMQGALIEDNISLNAPTTCAFGTFGINNGDKNRDIIYRNNKVINPKSKAFQITKDTAEINDTEFGHISVIGNEIEFSTFSGQAFLVGTGNNSIPQVTDKFHHIWFDGNKITYGAECLSMHWESSPIAFMGPASEQGFRFVECQVMNNIFHGNRRNGGWVILAKNWDGGRVEGNRVLNVPYGINMMQPIRCSVQHNVVNALYRGNVVDRSRGGNRVDATNKLLGHTDVTFEVIGGAQQGDVFESPTLWNEAGQLIEAWADWIPGAIKAGGTASKTMAITGISYGDHIEGLDITASLQGCVISGVIEPAGTLVVSLKNGTGAKKTFGATYIVVKISKPLFV